jgi:hypothetical protein
MSHGAPTFWDGRDNDYTLDQSVSRQQKYIFLRFHMYTELPTFILILRIKSSYAQAMIVAAYIRNETAHCMIFLLAL